MKIVIIDDEPKIRKGLTKIVEMHKDWYVLQSFADGLSAIEYLKDVEPDVVITDIHMPGATGLEMIEAIHDAHKNTRFIILTGYARFDYAQKAIDLGVRKFLLKPTNPSELVEALETIESELKPDNSASLKANNNLLIMKAEEYIQLNYRSKINQSEVAAELYISPNYLSDLFKKNTGMKFSDYVTEVRLEKAKELLLDVHNKVGDIAELVGFTDPRYFSSVFRKKYGMTPREFRNSQTSD
ncbi:MAG: response regulator [Lachnospiraceae bacterium]|nr:response regulator [Candidatus Equihabitans merdae]